MTIIKRFLLLIVGLSILQAGALSTLPDITGSGATVQITTQHRIARWVQVSTPTSNTAAIRVGDSAVSATQGTLVAPGFGQFFPFTGQPMDISEIYVYAASGDKVAITWLNF